MHPSLSNTSVAPPVIINRVGGTSEFCSHGAGGCWEWQLLASGSRTDCAVLLIRARLDVHGRFDPFSDAQGTPGLRIGVSQRGPAKKCSASRIRRGSRRHLAEAYALGAPMKDRL